jgi:hypothetical protein
MAEDIRKIGEGAPSEERTVVAPQKPVEIAAKPHKITIVLGLFSPVLAFVALVMSYWSYRTAQDSLFVSQQSLQVGQRAYLQSAVEIEGPYAVGYDLTWQVKAKLHNSGNTPALKPEKSTHLSVAPKQIVSDALDASARDLLKAVVTPSEDGDVTIGAKESEEYDLGLIVANKDAWKANYDRFLSRGRTLLIPVSIEVNYVDVFTKRHSTTRNCDILPSDDFKMKLVSCYSSGT